MTKLIYLYYQPSTPHYWDSTPTWDVINEVFNIILCSIPIWYINYYPYGFICVGTSKGKNLASNIMRKSEIIKTFPINKSRDIIQTVMFCAHTPIRHIPAHTMFTGIKYTV